MGKIIMKILKEPEGVVSPGKLGFLRSASSNRIRHFLRSPIARFESPAMLPNLRESSDAEAILSERAARLYDEASKRLCDGQCRNRVLPSPAPSAVDHFSFLGKPRDNMYLTMFCYKFSSAAAVRDMASNLQRKWLSLIDEMKSPATPPKRKVPIIEGACLFTLEMGQRLINTIYFALFVPCRCANTFRLP